MVFEPPRLDLYYPLEGLKLIIVFLIIKIFPFFALNVFLVQRTFSKCLFLWLKQRKHENHGSCITLLTVDGNLVAMTTKVNGKYQLFCFVFGISTHLTTKLQNVSSVALTGHLLYGMFVQIPLYREG